MRCARRRKARMKLGVTTRQDQKIKTSGHSVDGIVETAPRASVIEANSATSAMAKRSMTRQTAGAQIGE